MKKELAFLLIGFLIGSAITFGCARLFGKPGRMFWATEDLTITLDTTAHIVNRQDEKLFAREMVLPKGTCFNDDGVSSCQPIRFLKLTLAFPENEVTKYFSESYVKGNTPFTRVSMLYRTKSVVR